MALKPKNARHKQQIEAGTEGRKHGHKFEEWLTAQINALDLESLHLAGRNSHMVTGEPARELITYICRDRSILRPESIRAWWLGGLATSGLGDILHTTEGVRIKRSKSDVLIEIEGGGQKAVVGVSTKTCNKATPTNDQLYFTTASAFCALLRARGVPASQAAEDGLRMFCGDSGYSPADMGKSAGRNSDPDRWFFEELDTTSRSELVDLFCTYQDQITRILLQLAYDGDPHPPEYILHVTVKPCRPDHARLALFSVEELVALSRKAGGFALREYRIRKGRFKNDPNAHLAPRFGFVQFQRGGQEQHPTQLQFNLQAGYFDKLPT